MATPETCSSDRGNPKPCSSRYQYTMCYKGNQCQFLPFPNQYYLTRSAKRYMKTITNWVLGNVHSIICPLTMFSTKDQLLVGRYICIYYPEKTCFCSGQDPTSIGECNRYVVLPCRSNVGAASKRPSVSICCRETYSRKINLHGPHR